VRIVSWRNQSLRYSPFGMQPNELRSKLHGVISFPCTPFKKDLSLDLDGLRHNLRSLLKHPIAAVVAGRHGEIIRCLRGTSGGCKDAVEEVKGRVPCWRLRIQPTHRGRTGQTSRDGGQRNSLSLLPKPR
jgi:hypothetical protein